MIISESLLGMLIWQYEKLPVVFVDNRGERCGKEVIFGEDNRGGEVKDYR